MHKVRASDHAPDRTASAQQLAATAAHERHDDRCQHCFELTATHQRATDQMAPQPPPSTQPATP